MDRFDYKITTFRMLSDQEVCMKYNRNPMENLRIYVVDTFIKNFVDYLKWEVNFFWKI